ncbi:MAG TPA: phosphoenolpyruvate--protein phosphotransferase [candidate division Zixibacteria bacterium]|nr:phosphoenolpyruvate--protein phosphotransferase [candidate division Zixibacteria bacterium]
MNKEEIFSGIPASPGIIIGEARLLSRSSGTIAPINVSDPQAEAAVFQNTVVQVKRSLEKTAATVLQKHGADFARIFDAQAMIAGDEVWNKNIEARILKEGLCAEYIYDDEARKVITQLSESKDSYLKERIQDIQAVTARFIGLLKGEKQTALQDIKGPTVVVSRFLSPGDILAISSAKKIGFATGVGGPTSHAALMAKSLGVPAVLGIGELAERIPSGAEIIIDGYSGTFILHPTAATIKKYRELKASEIRLMRQLEELKDQPAVTKDDNEINVLANIELPTEVPKVLAAGAMGIGLYRTEYLFLTKADFPTFEEQYEAYSGILRRMGEKPVVIRTFDLGGDKFPGITGAYTEANPFLGWRAIRFCLDRPEVFKVQLKALLKASVFGNLSIMIPMISNYEEIIATKKILEECKEELRAANVKFKEKIPFGIMIEVPSAAIISEHLAPEVDFFSIGTNDLIQYTVAVDRDHELLAKLYQSFHPSVLALIKASVKAAHRYHRKVSVCGEMAADPLAAVLLIGLGVDELSSGFRMTGILKKVIRSITHTGARRIADHALWLKSHGEVEAYLKKEVSRVFPEIIPVIEFSRRNSHG